MSAPESSDLRDAVDERIVVKVRAGRCAELVDSGGCERFVIGKRTRKEVATVPALPGRAGRSWPPR